MKITPPAVESHTLCDPLLAPADEGVINAPDDDDDGGSLDQKLTPSYGKSLPEAMLLTV